MKPVKLIQIGISSALLGLVLWQANLFSVQGRVELVNLLIQASQWWLIPALLIGFFVNMSSALKWYMLLQARDIMVGYWRTFAYYVIGQFYNQFLPTSVGGDVLRSYQMGKQTERQTDVLASVFVERYTGILTLLVLAVVAALFHFARFSDTFVVTGLFVFVAGVAGLAWLVVDKRLIKLLTKKLPSGRFARLIKEVERVFDSIRVYMDQPSALIWAMLNSLLFYLLAVLNVYFCALVFDQSVAFSDMAIATPIIMLVMNLPISLGNIGLMEFAYSQTLLLMGYHPSLGLSIAILMRLKSLIDGVLGGILQITVIGRSLPELNR